MSQYSISRSIPKHTSNCISGPLSWKSVHLFGCRSDLSTLPLTSLIPEESRGLVVIGKAFRPIKRDLNGNMVYTKDLRNVYFHVNRNCIRILEPNFQLSQATVFHQYVNNLSQSHCTYLLGIGIEI